MDSVGWHTGHLAVLLLIWFSVDHKLVEFQKGKKKVTHVKVTIRYLEWEARFNQREWLKHWAEVNSHEEYALAKAFVHNNTTRVRFWDMVKSSHYTPCWGGRDGLDLVFPMAAFWTILTLIDTERSRIVNGQDVGILFCCFVFVSLGWLGFVHNCYHFTSFHTEFDFLSFCPPGGGSGSAMGTGDCRC